MNCAVCKANTSQNCARCKKVHYCSKECQQKDWKNHKRNCKPKAESITGPVHIVDYAMEYRKRFPKDFSGYMELSMKRSSVVHYEMSNNSPRVFKDEDFDPMRFFQRWKTTDHDELFEFLERPELSYGDIWNHDSAPWSSPHHHLLRNTPVMRQKLTFGETYVSIGFVDISSLLFAEFDVSKTKVEPLKFFGYDQSEIAVARSNLLYQMMRMEKNVSDKTILQVWFSSCWDCEATKEFYNFLRNCVPKVDSSILKKYASIWLRKDGNIEAAQYSFRAPQTSTDSTPLANLLNERDRTLYAQYYLTGCLFLDSQNSQLKPVCGNVTMFPDDDENWARTNCDQFFNGIDLGSSRFQPKSESLIEFILEDTRNHLKELRKHVINGKIECFFTVKSVLPGDMKLSSEIRSLRPSQIDWSNVPDYLPRLQFLDFAKECSTETTIHLFHTMNWHHKVYGASFFDYASDRKDLEAIYKKYQEELASNEFLESEQRLKLKDLIRLPKFNFPCDAFTEIAVWLFGEEFLKHFLRYRSGNILKHWKIRFHPRYQIFGDCDSVMFCIFCFNDNIE